ncbi:MAG: DUF2797 domain-containing protein [Candidatus Heimdallarchaeaceae archaeon]
MRKKYDSVIFSLFKDERELFYYESVVNSFSVLKQFGNSYQSFLVIRENVDEFYRVVLAGLITLAFEKKVCLRYGNEINMEDTSSVYCNKCVEEHERKYKECLFHSPYLIYNRKCTIRNILCKEKENIQKCFKKYYLYLGRFGNIIKVGVGNLYYSKYKYSRILNQGLNEAIIVSPFHSLEEATRYERFLIDEIGIEERIRFEEKVESLLEPTQTRLEDYFPLKQMKELFVGKKIIQMNFFPDNPLEHILSSSFSIHQEKLIFDLNGRIIYIQGNIGVLKKHYELVFFDVNRLVGRIVRRDRTW